MIIYYDWHSSPNCLKTKILLYELGVAFDQRDVDRPTLQSDAFRAKFPQGQAPALEDEDVRIAESSAIAFYLAEKHGALIPKDATRRALMVQAIAIEAAMVSPTLGGRGLFGELYKPTAERDPARIAKLRAEAQQVARVLGAVLGEREYFADELSIADIQLYAATSKALEARVFEDPPANLVAWVNRMTARPSVAKAREQYAPYRKLAA